MATATLILLALFAIHALDNSGAGKGEPLWALERTDGPSEEAPLVARRFAFGGGMESRGAAGQRRGRMIPWPVVSQPPNTHREKGRPR